MATTPFISASAPTVPTTPSTNMERGQHYHFFLNDGRKSGSDRPKLYEQLIAGARSKIIIWDQYIKEADMELLKHITHADKLILLTHASSTASSISESNCIKKRDDLYNQLKVQVPSSKKPSLEVTFAYIDKGIYGGDKYKCHDRFLIIDDTDYYLIGSSLEYHHKLRMSTGIMKVEHPADKDVIKNAFDQVYAEATSHSWFTTYPNLL